jgi:hypothetical protein
MSMPFTRLIVSMALAGAAVSSLQACGAAAKTGSVRPPAPPIIADPATSAPRGTLLAAPTRTGSFNPVSFKVHMMTFDGYGTLVGNLAGPLLCGIDIYHFKYSTVGAANEATTATGAIMVPTGERAECSGARPVVLYGHGNTRELAANMADLRVDAPLGGTALMAATLYASQGYVVVAPNYAGFDTSNLGYHPKHIADQQSKDLYDALTAARSALPSLAPAISQNGKLFITGFSEGGYAAMATHRAFQAAGIAVTASSPQAGNYAESVDLEMMLGAPGQMDNLAGAGLDEMLRYISKFTSWQKAYGNIYSTPSDLYPAAYATGIESLVPSALGSKALKSKLPTFLLANDMPHYSGLSAAQKAFFGSPEQSLLKTSYLTKIQADIAARPCPVTSPGAPLDCAPTHPARQAWLRNDLRTWVPASPMLMCGGKGDPVVGVHNTSLTMAYFASHGVNPGIVTVLDIESAALPGDPHALAKETFSQIRKDLSRTNSPEAIMSMYHWVIAYPACSVAARDFFNRF